VTEFALGQKLKSLGGKVQRPHRVVGMKQSEKDSRITDVSFEGGQIIRARYIIGESSVPVKLALHNNL